MKTVVVIPTYWTKAPVKGESPDAVYDHPTDLDKGPETLSRCLESLKKVEGKFEVVVITVPTREEISDEVEKRVSKILRRVHKDLKVTSFSPTNLKRLHGELSRIGHEDFIPYVNLRGYGNVRNLCLLVPYFLGSDIAVLIDDDEVVTDVHFLKKAVEFVGKRRRDKVIGGIAGYYTYGDRGYRLKEDPHAWWKIAWNKERLMNDAFRVIDSPRRLNPTSFALGGCMVIHRSLFVKVPFDPWITRGEDIDYLLSSKLYDFEFLLDNELSVSHMPPPKKYGFWRTFEQDVYRFIYQREKLKRLKKSLADFSPGSLDPFPGYFLKKDLEGKIMITGILSLVQENLTELTKLKTLPQFLPLFGRVGRLLEDAKKYAEENSRRYLRFQKLWEKVLTNAKHLIRL